jgi:cell division transport system permease protein
MIVHRLLFFVREALQGIKNNGFIHLVATGTIAFSLLTFGIFILTVINLDRIFDDWGKRMQVIVYLEVKSNEEAISAAKESISRLPQTERVTYISKEQSLKTLKKSLQSQADILDNLDENPLPPSFEVQLKEEHTTQESLQVFVDEVKKLKTVIDVDYGQEWLKKFSAFISMIKLVGMGVGGFLLLATVFIISNTIKLTIYSRREEIEIMKLVGATNFSIQIPFFLEGITQGFAASLLSLGVLFVSYKLLLYKITIDYSLYLGYVEFVFLPQKLIGQLILLGIVLGIFGCAFSMGRFLKA